MSNKKHHKYIDLKKLSKSLSQMVSFLTCLRSLFVLGAYNYLKKKGILFVELFMN